ncbi:MAG: hypothetical protein KJ018_17445 [Burkholderiales bacterium]|nr:hypothetical protein [Burkholderiales bacterium]
MRRRILLGLTVIVVAAAAESVHAAACATPSSFTDVAQSDIFCTDAEWLRNRGITTGCSLTEYCPLQFVTRGAMALFLQRHGTAFTPQVVKTETIGGGIDLDAETFVCVTSQFLYTDYPRRMVLNGHFSGVSDAPANFFMTIRYNTTGSTTQFPDFMNGNFEWGGMGIAGGQGSASTSATLDLAVGTPYRFAIRVTRGFGATTGELTQHVCHLVKTVFGRTGDTPPIDASEPTPGSLRQESGL